MSVEFSEKQDTLYHSIIGILLWVVEPSGIDISYEVSVLSRYLVHPRTCHFVQALHTCEYLYIHKDIDLVFNSSISELSDPLTIDSKIR